MAGSNQIPSGTETRRDPRTEMFLSAILKGSCGAQKSVRIRNISSGGALIETDKPPRESDSVELVRAHLKVPASVAWSKGHWCGLSFLRPIAIEYWVPSLSSRRQMVVDRDVAKIRRGDADLSNEPPPARLHDQLPSRIAEELATLGRQVELALDELAGFAPLVVRMPDPLQQLEIVSQTLGHLSSLLTAEDPMTMISQLGMDEFKRRLLR